MFLAIVCGYVGLGFATSDNILGCALVYAAGTYVSVIVSGETSIIVGSPSDCTYGTVIDAAVDYIARTEVLSCNSAYITGTSGRIGAPLHLSIVDASLYYVFILIYFTYYFTCIILVLISRNIQLQ